MENFQSSEPKLTTFDLALLSKWKEIYNMLLKNSQNNNTPWIWNKVKNAWERTQDQSIDWIFNSIGWDWK